MTSQRDVILLFAARSVRLFGYGLLAVVLVLYLDAIGLTGGEIGLLLALTLLGDVVISLWLTTHADRLGRRRVLVAGAILLLAAGLVFAATPTFAVLLVAATIGVISPSGNEIGPFLAVEQASLAQLAEPGRRTRLFARYQVAGAFATAAGALATGVIVELVARRMAEPADAYRAVIVGYALVGIVLALLFHGVTPAVEVPPEDVRDATVVSRLGLQGSQGIVLRLSALFALDAFAGGFVMSSFIAFWFSQRFEVEAALLGVILAAANVLAALSALAAVPLAARIGLVRTMVFTHLPSNVLLILVPLMPTLPLAALVLLVRFSISQMDVPTRQSYTMAMVQPSERSAAAGVTGIARSLGVAAAPLIAAPLLVGSAITGAPFVIAGSLKIVYDLMLYRGFRDRPPPEEREQDGAGSQGGPSVEPDPCDPGMATRAHSRREPRREYPAPMPMPCSRQDWLDDSTRGDAGSCLLPDVACLPGGRDGSVGAPARPDRRASSWSGQPPWPPLPRGRSRP